MGKKSSRTFQSICRICTHSQFTTMHYWEVLGDKRCSKCGATGTLVTKDSRFAPARKPVRKVLEGQLALPIKDK